MHGPTSIFWANLTPFSLQLYTLRARLQHADTLLDEVLVTFGVRRAVFKADGGFELNDAPLQIRGFCNHETFGGTGSA